MVVCEAYGCTNDRRSGRITTFHIFPKDPVRRAAWTKAVGRGNWQPKNRSFLCSDHFTEDCMDRTSMSCVRLREHAIPAIFPTCPNYQQKRTIKRKSSLQKKQLSPKSSTLPRSSEHLELTELKKEEELAKVPVDDSLRSSEYLELTEIKKEEELATVPVDDSQRSSEFLELTEIKEEEVLATDPIHDFRKIRNNNIEKYPQKRSPTAETVPLIAVKRHKKTKA